MTGFKKIITLLVLVLTISACTVRTAYNYIDWYLAWQIDDYVELNDEQEEQFEQAIDEFIVWHRSQELPKYKQMLTELQLAIEQQDKAKLESVFNYSRTLWFDSAKQAAPSIILLLDKLSLEQRQELVNNISTKQQEDHDKWRERAKTTSKTEREEEEVEELTDTLGELTQQQQQEFLITLSSLVSTTEMRIKSRELWLQKFSTALTSQTTIDQLTLYELFTDISSYRSAEHISISRANQQKYMAFLSSQLPSLTVQQQQHVIESIRDYIEDLEYLIQQNS